MTRVLITAFEPYGTFKANASWLALVEMAQALPTKPEVTTRLYPVDFTAMEARLRADLERGFDVAIHLGQAPGASKIEIESIAVNVAQENTVRGRISRELVPDGPTALQTRLPVEHFAETLRQADIPAVVSFHAGTYLCNGVFYLSQYLSEQLQLKTQSVFVHMPLASSQVVAPSDDFASLPVSTLARALALIVTEVAAPSGQKELA